MKQTLVLGNIITMDPKRPFAKAALAKDGVFAYVGDAEVARELAGADAEVLDYGENFVYPGFLESHTHGYMAGERAIGAANLLEAGGTDYDKYAEIMRAFIEKNPGREAYMATGWVEGAEKVTKAYLDEVYADKPLVIPIGA